ncbi:hypothetical protein ABW19_dt0209281 [Dactylella cylindrospora]|nr:hypothetical protein ABW19_dt0209281 [Dactylella cylindrospora]
MFRFVTYLFLLIAAVSASTLKFDPVYNKNGNIPLTSFACSDGQYGLITKYNDPSLTTTTLSNKLRDGVYLAASPVIPGWNSPNCGKCYRARLRNSSKSFLYVAIDVASPAIVSGQDAFTILANPSAGQLPVYITELPLTSCFK